ncbi:MAG: TatD family hydrolase [Mycoplasmoidaceae bacterium]
MIYDTHAHLNLDYSEEEILEIIEKTQAEQLFINIIGVDVKSSKRAINIAKQNSKYFFATVGIHPNTAAELSYKEIDKAIDELENLIKENRTWIKGIGETGLDYFRSNKEQHHELQFYSLNKHLALAQKYDLPLILHVRDAHEDMIKYLKTINHKRILIHCYSDNLEHAKAYVAMNCKISISGIVTFPKAIELKEVVREINLKDLFVETDCPYLAPIPFRGKKNSSLYTKYVVMEIAKIKNLDLEETKKEIFNNSSQFFNI